MKGTLCFGVFWGQPQRYKMLMPSRHEPSLSNSCAFVALYIRVGRNRQSRWLWSLQRKMQARKKRELDLSVETGNTVQAFGGPWGLCFQIRERTSLRERIGAGCSPEWENGLLRLCWMKRKMKRRERCSETLFRVLWSSAVSYQFRVEDCSMTWQRLRWDQRANCIAVGLEVSV